MKLKRLLLVNYCQHARTEITFDNGLTAIIGPNGIGKSNIVYAIKFALIGECDQDGVKADNIRDIAPPGEHSFVELDFSHDGIDYRIVRKLRPTSAKSELQAGPDTQPVYGDNAVTDAVLRVLGVEKSTIQELMIVPQESMFGFLDRTPAKRLESWQRVLKLTVLETARQAIVRHLTQNPIAAGPSEDELSKAEATVGEATVRLANARDALLQHRPVAELTAAVERLVVLSQQYSQYVALQQRVLESRNNWANVVASANAVSTQVSAVEQQLAAMPPALDTGPLRQQLALLNDYMTVQSPPAQPQIVPYPQAAGADEELSSVFGVEDREAQQQYFLSLRSKYAQLRDEYVAYQRAFADGVCPRCQQRVEFAPPNDIDPQVVQTKLELLELLLRTVSQNLATQRAWQYAENTFRSKMELLQSQATALGFTWPLPPANSVEFQQLQAHLQQQHSAASQANLQRQSVEQSLQQVRQAAARAQAQVESAQAVLQRDEHALQQAVAVAASPDAELQLARQQLFLAQTAAAAVQAAEAEVTAVQGRLTTLRQLAERARITAEWHSYVTRLNAWLAPGGLPKLVLHTVAQSLVAGITARLQLAGADFRTEISPEMEFVAHFDDGRKQPDKRLSQGQKDLLGLVFRLALTEVTTEGLNVLVIDEPTADLDAKYRDRVLAVIDNLRESAVGSGLQVIIVTHSKSLADRCDRIVDLTPGVNA